MYHNQNNNSVKMLYGNAYEVRGWALAAQSDGTFVIKSTKGETSSYSGCLTSNYDDNGTVSLQNYLVEVNSGNTSYYEEQPSAFQKWKLVPADIYYKLLAIAFCFSTCSRYITSNVLAKKILE